MNDWSQLLDQLDEAPVGRVAEALADARDLDVLDAFDVVDGATEIATRLCREHRKTFWGCRHELSV